MNYVDHDFVADEIGKIHRKGYDIEINWLTREFRPAQLESERIKKSIGYWGDNLKKHCASHSVNLENLCSLSLSGRQIKVNICLPLTTKAQNIKFTSMKRRDTHITIGSNRSLRSLGRAKARPLTKR
jgi:hypothetical protein